MVPAPGVLALSGGFTPGLVGIERGRQQHLQVRIDPEDGVAEVDEQDNVVNCMIEIAPDGSEATVIWTGGSPAAELEMGKRARAVEGAAGQSLARRAR